MKAKQLGILVIVAVVLVGLTVLKNRSEHRSTESSAAAGKPVLANLPLNDVERIVVAAPSGTSVVSRVDGAWRVPGKFNYPASFTKVRDLLRKLADVKVLQPVKLSPAQMAELQLALSGETGSTNAGALATTVTLQGTNGKVLAALRLGKNRMRSAPAEEGMPGGFPDGRFVATDREHVFLIGETLDEASSVDKDWMDTEAFVNVDGESVVSVDVVGATNGAVHIERPASGGDLAFKTIPAGKEMDTAKVNRLKGALAYLRFDDLADPNIPAVEAGFDKPVAYKAVTKKGEVYTVTLGKLDKGDTHRYAKIAVAFDAAAFVPPAAPAAGTNAPAAKDDAVKKAAETVKALNERISPWVYLLDRYTSDSMAIGAEELLANKPAPPPAEPPKTETRENPAVTEETPQAPKVEVKP